MNTTEILTGNCPSETAYNPGKTGNHEQAMAELEKSIYNALERYSNVHRGSGHFSKASTHLYEKARQIVLDHLRLRGNRYEVLFLSPRRAKAFTELLRPECFKTISSKETGLSLGVSAVAIQKNALPKDTPFETGGGTTKLYGPDWVLWANHPDRFEAGTPAIINIIAFSKMLQIMKRRGKDVFQDSAKNNTTPAEILYSGEWNELQGLELLQRLRETMIGSAIQVPTTSGFKNFINFDNSASTQAFSPVWEAFRKSLRLNDQARHGLVKEVRQICSEILGAPLTDYDIIFTSNTTESINITALGLGKQATGETEPVILTTVLEHSSNDLPWRTVPGHTLLRLSADNEGVFDLKELEVLLSSYNSERLQGKKRIRMVTVSGASNVLGTCNDLTAISEIVHRHGAMLVVDAAQLVAHRKIGMSATGIDGIAFSAHKIYAPFGTGVLIVRKGMLQFGDADWNLINASGEENTGGIAALGKSLLLLQRIGFDLIEEEETKLTNKALKEISLIPGIEIHGMKVADQVGHPGKTGVIGFSVKSGMPATVARRLAFSGGMGVRFGCLCSHLIIKQLGSFTPFQEKFQRLVVKMVPILNLQGIMRVSLGIQNTEADVDALINELQRIMVSADTKQKNKDQHMVGNSEITFNKKEVKKQFRKFIESSEMKVFGQ
ncbi:MAG: aminotransferase class V-fold PLP-dependent enzyme [Bacteroidales bacterium]|nr:aminotransferase class V-fold PLP-dependent enzyme [Bacteroidales bacterium]